jgi:hypothetical protein
MSQRNAFCLITVKPNKIWLDFLTTMTHDYDIFMVLDDSTIISKDFQSTYENIVFIQIDDDECKRHGFWDSSFMIKKNPSGWDKALYYFTQVNQIHQQCWFCEDDVLFSNVNTIVQLDTSYKEVDLLCNTLEKNSDGHMGGWHWQQAKPHFSLPWLKAMVCCCRLSRPLLGRIALFAEKYNKLTFIECMFPTLARGLRIETPPQFSTIHWRNEWTHFKLNSTNLYHPFKNVGEHPLIRRMAGL